ncbi:DUF2911 domain-containing protein [Hymenobacter sp. 5516J-16]|uniref:DUF2911 domain-containing protein n=1 Tax=Hymenobacter sp. 5516J-16 TaxID=2932253 RepID=UPI001FCFB0C7|nr:DUF2911 domain-containing protein [Hymenobacter sp. 5516J-16]UOQ77294.1 DUF2911 domain-containing protein [Hymenobacter sp. 5516J-16]
MKNLHARLLLALSWLCLLLLAAPAFAQKPAEDKSKRPSPPATVTGPTFTIDYSRPSLKGRKAFGGQLVPYGQVWRTGANEATTFEAKQAVTINGQTLPAGKYALFTIPGEQEWTIIFNKTANQWGAFKYDAAQDALRVKVTPTKTAAPVEQFTISSSNAGVVTMAWENAQASFTVK